MLTPRRFLASSAPVLLVPTAVPRARAAALKGGKFSQGVMSGDPTPTGITLLTLLDDAEGPGTVMLEVAKDAAFKHVVASKKVAVSAGHHYSAKARVTGLKA